MVKAILLSLAFLLTLTGSSFSQSPKDFQNPQKSQFFIENKGQWDSQVKYLARLSGMNYWITNSGIVMDYYRFERDENEFLDDGTPNMQAGHIKKLWGHVIKSTILDLNQKSYFKADDPKESYYNYFLGNDPNKWASNVPLFSYITMKNAYEGIDIKFYHDENSIRYDFIVNPGSNPNQIKIKYEGQNSVKINSKGEIVFSTSIGDVEHNKLFAYQNTPGTSLKQVECKFIDLGDGIVALNVGNYDSSLPLIIDPYVFGTYIGGTSSDYPYSVTADNSGNTIVGGYTSSSNFPVTSGAYDISYSSTDGTISKFNTTGSSLIYSTFIGGTSTEYIYGIKCDVDGNVYIGGYTGSSNYPTTSGCWDNTLNSTDGFLTKLNPTGSALVYSTYFGGSSTEYCYAIDIDASGNVYATGYTSSSDFPYSSGCWDNTYNSTDSYLFKLNSTGNSRVFGTYLGGTSSDYGYGVAVDQLGYASVTGYTSSSNFPTTSGCWDNTYNSTDIYVTKFNQNGTGLMFSTYLGGTSSEYGYAIETDANNNVIVAGYTNSTDYPKTSGVIDTYYYSAEGIITKFSPTGSMIFSTYLGGNNSDYIRGIALDSDNNILVSGYTYSTDFARTADAFQYNYSSTPDAFLTKVSPTGTTVLYSSYLGGNNTDLGYYFSCISSDNNNGAIIVGYTYSTNFPITSGCYQNYLKSGPDGFVSRFSFEPPLTISTGTIVPNNLCKGDFLQVSYTIDKGTPKAGNVFSVQLSDENGNFASPRVIGTLQSLTAGTINCQMPDNSLPPGTNYKIRITSSSPATISAPSNTLLTVYPPPFTFNVIGENGYCANAKVGSEIGLEDTEKYTYYQLYYEGNKVGNPIAGTDQPISFGRYKNTGIYTVEATSPFGCKNFMNGQIDVVIIPMPLTYNMTGGGEYFDQPGNGTYCEGSDGVAMGLSHGDLGVNYQIMFNGKPITVAIQGRGDKISFGYFTEEGTYTVDALSLKGGCMSEMSGSLTVKMLPAPKTHDLLSTGGFCEGSAGTDIKLGSSDIGYAYQLFYNGKAIGSPKTGTGEEINFGKFNKAGEYTVVATNVSSSCTKMMNGTVTLKPVAAPSVYDINGEGKFCKGHEGAVITLSNSSTDVLYELYRNNKATGITLVGTGAELTFNPVTETGAYTIFGTTINGGCTVPMNGIVSVVEIPLPDVTIAGNKTPEMNSTEKYSAQAPQENDTYLWKATNGEIIGSNTSSEIEVKWADKKSGTVELYRVNGWGCTNWEVTNIDLKNVLTADFEVKKDLGDAPFLAEFENKSTGFVSSYVWDFGDGTTSPQVNPSHTYKQMGKYTVKLTISHENETKTVTKSEAITVLAPNSVEEDGQTYNSNHTAGVSLIEPNPAKNDIRFEYFLTFDQNIELSIFDVLGNKVMDIQAGLMSSGTHNKSVNITNLANGNYYLQLRTADGNITKHFTINK